MPSKKLIDDVPADLKGSVALTRGVCSDCANCPGVHILVDGSVVITNDHSSSATAVHLTAEQWKDLTDGISTGQIY